MFIRAGSLALVLTSWMALAQEAGVVALGEPVEELSIEGLLQAESLLEDSIAAGDVGGFGFRLESLKTSVGLHAYATLDYTYLSASNQHSFDAHYFNVFVNANIADRVFPELQLEIEHVREVGARFAQVDVKAFDFLVVRAGLFLVPFGTYNEFLYPEYLNKVPRSPLALTHADIIPVAWNEVGLQLRGRVPLGKHSLNYAVYVVNGLQQADPAPGDGVIQEGGGIRAMRGNWLGLANPRKSFGGRVGGDFFNRAITVGVSGYRGNYTVEGDRALSMYGFDLTAQYKDFWLMIEGVRSHQEITSPTDPAARSELVKQGIYAVASYKIADLLEPAIAFDRAVIGGASSTNKSRTTFCLNVYPVRKVHLVTRASYTVSLADNGARDDIFMIQSSIGF